MPRSNGPKFAVNNTLEFIDADAARTAIENHRWPDGIPTCPHCEVKGRSYRIVPKTGSKTRKGVWKCGACRKQFTVTVGSIFEDSHIPLNTWLYAIHLMCASKKSMSAFQLHRMLGITAKSAWFLAHRIRYSMTQEPLSSKLAGFVECDETYVGGKEHGKRGIPGPDSKKTPVVSLVERNGRVRSFPVQRVTLNNIRPLLKEHVSESAHLMTDESPIYYQMRGEFAGHSTVNHKRKQYAYREDGKLVTTNTVEGYFSLAKRAIYGTYHHVSREHLHRYFAEFDFRYNARKVSDVMRAGLALSGTEGKRLMYRDSCGKRS